MDEAIQPSASADNLGTVLISPGYTDRAALIAGMLAAAHAAIARVAMGATWEGESDIVVDRDQAAPAYRASQVWIRAAEYLQGSDAGAIAPCGPSPSEPARKPPIGCRERPPSP